MKILLLKTLLTLSILFISAESYNIGNNGCADMIRVSSASSINLPEKYASKFDRPWLTRNLKTRFYSSKTFAKNWQWFKSLKIQGINSTFGEILQIFEQNDCFFVGYGSGIKNILLGKIKEQSLLRISGETTCNNFKLHEICSKNFGSDSCGVAPSSPKDKIIVGNSRTSKELNEILIEPISIFSWDSMLEADRLKWGFTVNECGLLDNYSGNVYLIDYTTQSQMDICEHSVKIPVQRSYWNKWANNNLLKILEVYNLVADGFTVEQREYQFFIDFIKANFNTVNFQEYFCTFLYGGKFYPWITQTSKTKVQIQNRSQCHFLTLDFRRTRLIQNVNQTLKEDFGEFWHQNMTSSLIGMYNFEDKGKPQISFMKMFTVNHRQRSENKNGRTRQRNVINDEKTISPYSEFSSTTKTAAPPSGWQNAPTKTVQVTLNVNCDQNVVTIIGKTGTSIFQHPSTVVKDSSLSAPNAPASLTKTKNIEKTYVRAQDTPHVPLPSNAETKNIENSKLLWNSWNSGTPNPNVRYYSKDEIPRVLASDY